MLELGKGKSREVFGLVYSLSGLRHSLSKFPNGMKVSMFLTQYFVILFINKDVGRYVLCT